MPQLEYFVRCALKPHMVLSVWKNAAFWKRLYATNIRQMIGFFYRYVNDLALAKDLSHKAFLKVLERPDTYCATGHLKV